MIPSLQGKVVTHSQVTAFFHSASLHAGHGNIQPTLSEHEWRKTVDRYTKTVLTIIAISLVWIATRDIPVVSNAMASTGLVEVKVVGLEIPSYRPIPVKVQGKIECRD